MGSIQEIFGNAVDFIEGFIGVGLGSVEGSVGNISDSLGVDADADA